MQRLVPHAIFMILLSVQAVADVGIRTTQNRLSVPVKSFLEIRESNLVRQGWDISCGAAALSTLLTYEFGQPYSEATIAVSILANTDPQKVRERGGFSLLDLKRFSEAVGFKAEGYGRMSAFDLKKASQPAILPVRIRGFDHFLVYRRHLGDRVEIGDPAFGNMVVSESRFLRMWTSGIAFFVRPSESSESISVSSTITELGVSDLKAVYRWNSTRGLRPVHNPPSELR